MSAYKCLPFVSAGEQQESASKDQQLTLKGMSEWTHFPRLEKQQSSESARLNAKQVNEVTAVNPDR